MKKTVDVIIPLQDGGSEHGDLELRYLLRSLYENADGVRIVIVVSGQCPPWLASPCAGVMHVPCADIYAHNKDGNIFRKVLAGLLRSHSEEVVWTCDDCALLQPCDLAAMPVSHALDGAASKLWKTKSQWTDRMRRTFGYVHGRTGKWLPVMYDSHLPQRLNRAAAIRAIEDCSDRWDVSVGGININTAIVPFAMPADAHGESIPWGRLKCAFEKNVTVQSLGDRQWVSYNDFGWDNGVARLLEERFPTPCVYERA